MRPGCWVCLLMLLSVSAHGQAVVEHSVITAGSSLGAASGKGVGKSIGSVFSELNKVIDKAGKPSAGAVPRSSQPLTPTLGLQPQSQARQFDSGGQQTAAQGAEARPTPVPKDYMEIAVGLSRGDLLRRFGEPSMRTTVFHGARVVETIWYTRADQQAVEVTVEDGKVTKVSQSPSAEGLSAGVVVLE